MTNFSHGINYAVSQDELDPLADYGDQFWIDDPDLLYFDGNSLGRLPKKTIALASDLLEKQWGERLIRGWGEGWYHSPERIGEKIAGIIGARPDEVIVADSTSVNLFKLAVAAFQRQPGRSTVVTDNLNFPSDLYILEGAVKLFGNSHKIQMCRSGDGVHGPVDEIQAVLTGDTALLTLSHAVFKSGYLYDMASMTRAAHQAGALTLWDLSHSVGAVPIDLTKAGVDLAVGCTYKYLNGGPGAPAFLFVRRELQEELNNPISGWMGSAQVFDFSLEYQPYPGLRKFLTGTPAVLSLALIEPGVDLLNEAGLQGVREKSVRLSEYLIWLIDQQLVQLGFELKSPREPEQRGSHVSLSHPEGWRINQALIEEMNVIPDFRAPDNIRLGIAPLYTRYVDVFNLVGRIEKVVQDGLYKKYPQQMTTVT